MSLQFLFVTTESLDEALMAICVVFNASPIASEDRTVFEFYDHLNRITQVETDSDGRLKKVVVDGVETPMFEGNKVSVNGRAALIGLLNELRNRGWDQHATLRCFGSVTPETAVFLPWEQMPQELKDRWMPR